MSKKRKTRQQKKIAELRHKLNLQHSSFEAEPEGKKETQKEKKSLYTFEAVKTDNTKKITEENASTVDYVYKDLKKTSILTASIIGLELILYFFLKTHLLFNSFNF